MAKQIQGVQELIEALRQHGVSRVEVARRIATTTNPGGDQIAFRGRLVVSADTPSGETLEYVEHVMPYIASTKSPQLPATAETAPDLRAAQAALAGQLRAYRGEYQGVVGSARGRLVEVLKEAGMDVVEPEE
ncbi:MAG: hypothetical protein JSV79_14340 [Armatimonadota bacterium]|nr:MAG: hypothetical protein JSV79_14340 [Armatimonadota bacterium]